MDNAAILATNGKEYNGIDNFRTNNENIRQEAVNPRIRPAQSDTGQGTGTTGVNATDLVELSRESINLAAYAENANQVAARVEVPEPRPVEETLMEPANANLVTAIGMGPENTLSPASFAPAAEREAQNTANYTNTNINTTTTGVSTETASAAGQDVTTATAVPVETNAVTEPAPAPENIAAETASITAMTTTPQTTSELAASTAVPEPPTGTGTTTEPPVTPPLEEQANQLTRLNSSLAAANSMAVGASGPEPATPAESTRNEQQILLQQLSSQLAQVIPPASVFSVVG